MSYTIPASSVIGDPPEVMALFQVYIFEWIDNLHFIQPPERFLADPSAHVEAARAVFRKAGWNGEGKIGLLWLPPFVFPTDARLTWRGLTVWHVKQSEDGISWLLSPISLPFEAFGR